MYKVFMAFRSYSYWLMIVSLIMTVVFWLYKVFSTKHVIELTKKLYKSNSQKNVLNKCSYFNGYFIKTGTGKRLCYKFTLTSLNTNQFKLTMRLFK